MKNSLLILAILSCLTSCLKDKNINNPVESITPTTLNDGWQVSSPFAEGIDESGLTTIYESIATDNEYWQLKSLLVIRNGNLVAENYFKDENDISNPAPIWSCTKQILALLTGIAIKEGHINSIDDPISYYIPEVLNYSSKSNITINDLLLMQGGIDFDESKDVSKIMQNKAGNVLEFILSLPQKQEPGVTYDYNSGETHLLAVVLQNAVNKPLEQWADEVLFSKIGFENYSWLAYDGYNFGGYGISTTPRSLGKIAQLTLDYGNWGQNVVDSTWIAYMTSTQTITEEGSDYTFGYLWWINETENIQFMAGSGGQYAVIDPDKELVIVITSYHDTDGDSELAFAGCLDIVNRVRAVCN